MLHLSALAEALTEDLGAKGSIQWIVEDLHGGSAIASVRGEAVQGHETGAVHQVVRAYAAVGQSLERGERLINSDCVIHEAEQIIALIGQQVVSVRFETDQADAIVSGAPMAQKAAIVLRQADGAVEGRIQMVTTRGGLRFTLYDTLYDRAVHCFLNEGQDELAREMWGRQVLVEGLVRRDPVLGHPLTIRQIVHIHAVQMGDPGSYRQARALLPLEPGEVMPEGRIRRICDAG